MKTRQTFSADIKKARGEPVLAVIYARYSSHNQTEQSIEGQIAAGRAYASAHGYAVIEEYIDRAISGRTDNRADFQRMLADTDKKAFDVIIVWKVDRFGRNREEIAFNKHRCKRNGIKLEYVAETLTNSPESIILESVLEGMAEYYSVQLATNVSRGLRQSAEKAKHAGGRPSLGYRIDPQTKKYQIDPDTAPIVQLVYDMYAEGMTVTEINKHLNSKGFVTKLKNPFGKNSLYHMLSNERYIGTYLFHEGQSDEIRIENAIPPIIEKSVFYKVQDMLKVNRRAPASKWSRADYILTGKIFCGLCNSPMVGESGTSKTGAQHNYYSCTKHRREKGCNKKAVRQEWIESIVLRHVYNLLHNSDLLEWIADKTWEYYKAQDTAQTERDAIQVQLDAVNVSINNIVKAIEAGLFNSALQTRMEELDSQKKTLTASLAEFDVAQDVGLTRDHILFFLMQFRDMDETDRECQKRLISTFVNAVYVFDDKITIGFNYSGPSNAVTIHQIQESEAGSGFVCCTEIPTKQESYELFITGRVFLLHIKLTD